jgi:predicted kinase
VSEQVYAIARKQAAQCLTQGWPVIADAVFDRPEDRVALERVAAEAGATFIGVWLDAPHAALAARVCARTGDPSDATVDVLLQQKAKLATRSEPMTWVRMDATQPPQDTAAAIAAQLYSAGSRASG